MTARQWLIETAVTGLKNRGANEDETAKDAAHMAVENIMSEIKWHPSTYQSVQAPAALKYYLAVSDKGLERLLATIARKAEVS